MVQLLELMFFLFFFKASAHTYVPEGNVLVSDDITATVVVHDGLPIGNLNFNHVHMSTNALITFERPVYNYVPNNRTTYPLVAPYWTDLYPIGSNGGYVYYKVYTSGSTLEEATSDVRLFGRVSTFQAKWVLVTTWYNTTFYPRYTGSDIITNMPPRVTVQCVLITDHRTTYTLFNYINVNIPTEFRGIRIGFDNGTSFHNQFSFTPDTYRMSSFTGNTGLAGIWFYTLAADVNDCASGPCLHGAGCVDLYGDFRCNCPAAFTGKRCETDINECITQPCYYGSCTNTMGSYFCTCNTGWTGRHCRTDIDECLTDGICGHGACSNTNGSFHCNCIQGWSGPRCDQDVDECSTSSPCCNGGSCLNNPGSFSCNCATGWTGSVCEKDVDECVSTPCSHGDCQNIPGSYLCLCRKGYTGSHCHTDVNECQSVGCRNNGTCTNTKGSFNCNCDDFFTGKYCEEDINECSIRPPICKNGGTCENLCGGYKCHCPPGRSGNTCDADVNECLEWTLEPPCKHGGLCINTEGSFHCKCSSNWTGSVCQEDVNECRNFPCQNDGECSNFQGGFGCTCGPGFTGALCELDINECLSEPCKNNVSCVNTYGSYKCQCVDNWGGKYCEIDLCKTKPAQLVFIVDTSFSTSDKAFQQQKDFISDVISRISIGNEKFRVAVASYGTNTSIDIGFDAYEHNKTVLLDQISTISFRNGTTDIHNASYNVREILNNTKGSNQFVFFFTDGMPSDLQLAINGTGELRARLLNSSSDNALMFVAFGDDVRHEGFKRMSGDPHYNDVFTHISMDPLYYVMKRLVDEKCTACFHQYMVDLMFVMDVSSSLPQETFSGSLRVIHSILDRLKPVTSLGQNQTQIGAVYFSNEPHLLMQLNETYDFDSCASKIMGIKQDCTSYRNSSTNVAKALEFTRSHLLFPKYGARNSSQKLLIHIYTGFDANITETVKVTRSLARDKITIFSIGVGDKYKEDNILSTASSAFHAFFAELKESDQSWRMKDTELLFISKIYPLICTGRINA